MASIRRWEWRTPDNKVPGVMVQAGPHKTFIPKHQLAVFADFMIDALESYGDGTSER